jgi:hypothetical protein
MKGSAGGLREEEFAKRFLIFRLGIVTFSRSLYRGDDDDDDDDDDDGL